MKPNKPLADYARAAHGLSSPAVVVRKEEIAPADEDEEVLGETRYHFSDGAVLQYRIETDLYEGTPEAAPPACRCGSATASCSTRPKPTSRPSKKPLPTPAASFSG